MMVLQIAGGDRCFALHTNNPICHIHSNTDVRNVEHNKFSVNKLKIYLYEFSVDLLMLSENMSSRLSCESKALL